MGNYFSDTGYINHAKYNHPVGGKIKKGGVKNKFFLLWKGES